MLAGDAKFLIKLLNGDNCFSIMLLDHPDYRVSTQEVVNRFRKAGDSSFFSKSPPGFIVQIP